MVESFGSLVLALSLFLSVNEFRWSQGEGGYLGSAEESSSEGHPAVSSMLKREGRRRVGRFGQVGRAEGTSQLLRECEKF